jgi:hypothetical protein
MEHKVPDSVAEVDDGAPCKVDGGRDARVSPLSVIYYALKVSRDRSAMSELCE